MILRKSDVARLQFFLMDAARRSAEAASGAAAPPRLLASAAALDYVLFVVSERPDETLADGGAVAASLRETLARAAAAALEHTSAMLGAPREALADFVARHVRGDGILEVLSRLRAAGALCDDEVAFKLITVASDIRARCSP